MKNELLALSSRRAGHRIDDANAAVADPEHDGRVTPIAIKVFRRNNAIEAVDDEGPNETAVDLSPTIGVAFFAYERTVEMEREGDLAEEMLEGVE